MPAHWAQSVAHAIGPRVAWTVAICCAAAVATTHIRSIGNGSVGAGSSGVVVYTATSAKNDSRNIRVNRRATERL